VEVLALQVFVSLGLVVGSILLFAFTCQKRTFDHADRLALLPIEEERAALAIDAAPKRAPKPGDAR
jgi:hypothetical protein